MITQKSNYFIKSKKKSNNNLAGNGGERVKYQDSRKKLEAALEKGQRKEMDSALADFEALLENEDMRRKEKPLLDRATLEIKNIDKREGISENFVIIFNQEQISTYERAIMYL